MGSHRQRLGRMETLSRLEALLSDRVVKGIESGYFPAPAGSLVRLFHGLSRTERQTVAMELRGDQALVWNQGEPTGVFGVEFVQRQQACIGGGTTEMARNIISERIGRDGLGGGVAGGPPGEQRAGGGDEVGDNSGSGPTENSQGSGGDRDGAVGDQGAHLQTLGDRVIHHSHARTRKQHVGMATHFHNRAASISNRDCQGIANRS